MFLIFINNPLALQNDAWHVTGVNVIRSKAHLTLYSNGIGSLEFFISSA